MNSKSHALNYTQGPVEKLYRKLDPEKARLLFEAKQYSKWTIPTLIPEDTDTDVIQSYIESGPRMVNSLANKIVNAMFPDDRPFFGVVLAADLEKQIREEAGEEVVAKSKVDVDTNARYLERYAMSKFGLVKYRPKAVEAAQHVIVTGNTVIRRLPDDSRVVYSLADFVVQRTMNGTMRRCIMRDSVPYEDLPQEAKDAVNVSSYALRDNEQHRLKYWLYTKVELVDKGYQLTQEVCGQEVAKTFYSKQDCPTIDLTWDLPRGKNYATGLVGQNKNAFANLNALLAAAADITSLLAQIKWIVAPDSMIDVKELNASKNGSYHVGVADGITSLMADKTRDLQSILGLADRIENELKKTFLMAGTTRDAERVTKYEIQLNALELEQAFGGLYSRFAVVWQYVEAERLLGSLNIQALKQKMFEVKIVTGVENLSRESALQAFANAVMDLQLFDQVPQDIRSGFDPRRVMTFIFANRGLDVKDFLYTKEEADANAAAAMKQQQQLTAQEAAASAAAQGQPA